MSAVLYEQNDGVAVITLNRPDSFNAIDHALSTELCAAFRRAEHEARAVVLTGAGRAFCSGADIKGLESTYRAGGAPSLGTLIDADFNPILHAIADAPLPVIAAVNGPAAGAGLGMALACDLRIASSTASFMMAFVNIGLVPDTGTAWTLPMAIGYSRAIEMAYSGRKVGADEALAVGLVHRLTEPDALTSDALAWATQLAAGPTAAYARTKSIMRRAVESDLRTAAAIERDEQELAGRSADHLEGIAAFLEKRPATFKGS